jgi:hypothetical protein
MQALPLPSLLNESIYFDYAPPPTFAGHINKYPFKVIITSSTDDKHVVNLTSKYSKSYNPQTNISKWSFLRTENRFLDLSGNQIDSVITNDTPLYIGSDNKLNTISGNFIGVSGYAEFYFVDDIYNYDYAFKDEKYTTIVAVLQTSGINFFNVNSPHLQSSRYSNSKAIAYQPHVFHYRDPDYIKISENGIRNFINPRWAASDQHVIFSFNWNKQYSQLYYEGNEVTPFKFDFNFNKSLPSNTNQDTINITSQLILDPDLYENSGSTIKAYFPNDKIQITYKNKDLYLSPGYSKTIFNINNRSSANVVLTASSEFYSPDITGNMYTPKMWLSNPHAGVMGIVEYNFPLNYNLEDKSLLKAQIHSFDVPILYEANFTNDSFATTGFHGINSIAVLPAPDYSAWMVDGELNYLYKFGSKGQLLSAIDLVKIVDDNLSLLVYDQVSPSSVVLDGNQNLWITLYDHKYVINLDKNGNYIGALSLLNNIPDIPYNDPPNINSDWYSKNESYPNGENIQNFVEPTILDVDSRNNIWVTYSNYASGYLLKFDTNNNILQTISYPVCSCPQDIIIDNQDNIWTALSNNIWRSIGSIEKRNTNGILLSSFDNIMGVNELALDLNQNLWFTYSYGRIGYIDNITGEVLTFNVLDNSDNSKYAQGINVTNPNVNTDETALEGIACDLKGYLYVVNSVENQIYVYNTKTKQYVDKFYVNPQGFTFFTKTENGKTEIEYKQWQKSLQAHGDWIGTRWINKYYKKDSTYKINLSGISGSLEFIALTSKNFAPQYSLLANTFYKHIETNFFSKIIVTPETTSEPIIISDKLDLFKVNENYDLAAQMKAYAITPTLFESSFLFDTFLPSIYGSYPYNHQDFGISGYEKIANFVINHSDVDTCEIDKLYSISDATNTDTSDYLLNYPSEIKRLMDVVSINQSQLWGSIQKNQNYFKQPGPNGIFNKGKLLTTSYTVTAGIPVILKTKSLNEYELIQTGNIVTEQYPISALAASKKLGDNWSAYYEFYEFIPTINNVYSDNIIDWNNPQTTITENLTSAFEWIGDEKMIDKLFSYEFYTGLGIF